ncbi:MAG: DUF58 domain-containing protein [Defluviitaleaceae bacterium]|nr:DUF58 domain-containing protein [Defluviitaleaceae bacterium]MCL2240823.1 DUF58 domain-containing protein [Defluviitaleaceae bacterium]
MLKNRVVYFIWLCAVGSLHIFGNAFGTRVILFASVVIPAVLILFTRLASRRVQFFLEAPGQCARGAAVSIRLGCRGGGMLPGYIRCRMHWENRFTGESREEEALLPPGGRDFALDAARCGLVVLTLKQPLAVDIFGLCRWGIPHQATEDVLVMPACVPVPIEISPDTAPAAESGDYSMHRPGSDPSETFAIREYIPGDPLKSIHWKLSGKTDTLLVRELGLPVAKNILVLMEPALLETPETPECISAMADMLYSVSRAFVMDGQAFSLGWLDTRLSQYKSRDITDIAELEGAFAELLANTVRVCTTTAAQAYAEASNEGGHSQIILVGAHVPHGMAACFPRGAVTVIDCAMVSAKGSI